MAATSVTIMMFVPSSPCLNHRYIPILANRSSDVSLAVYSLLLGATGFQSANATVPEATGFQSARKSKQFHLATIPAATVAQF